MRSIVSSIGAGPTLQLTPITAAPARSSAGTNCSGGAPSRLLPSSSVVICATIGRSHVLRMAAIAAPISFASRNVSSRMRSTPPSTSATTCSRKHASASSTPMRPQGSMRTLRGPMAPATYAPSRATCLAIRAPARLMSCSLSARPNEPSLMRLAPNVFVSMTSAPARRYSLCTSDTRSGEVRFSASNERFTNTPRAYSIVPIAPSQTSTRAAMASRKVGLKWCGLPWLRTGPGGLGPRRSRHEHVGLVPDEVLVAVDGGLVVLAHEDRRHGARLFAVAAEDAARLVNLVDLGVPRTRHHGAVVLG